MVDGISKWHATRGLGLKRKLAYYSRREGECIVWTSTRIPFGHGVLNYNGTKQLVHRLAWVAAGHEIPEGMCVLHRCDNPPCLNIDHLFCGTKKDNTQDMMRKSRNRNRAFPGAQHWNAKLSPLDVVAIRASQKSGAALAIEYGISHTQACRIKSGRAWK